MKAGPLLARSAGQTGRRARGRRGRGDRTTVTVWKAIEDAPRSSVARRDVVESPARLYVHAAVAPVASSK